MKIKDLISELQKYPENSTIGIFDTDLRIEERIVIAKRDDYTYDEDFETYKDLENFRISNKSKICDYYIAR